MQALVDDLGFLLESRHGLFIGDDDVRGGDGFFLVEAPYVQLVDGIDAGDLAGVCVSNSTLNQMWTAVMLWPSYLLEIMLHIVDDDTLGCALKQNLAGVLRLLDGYAKNHKGDEGTSCRVCIEALGGGCLPDDDGGDDDADVVDGIADDMDQNSEHAQVAAGLLDFERVVAVLGVVADGLGGRWSALVLCPGWETGVREHKRFGSLYCHSRGY